ncbi:MAG: energy-coupling factor transporter transmembrane component T [Desulfurispora sp.]|uniref:energy-coupling factor transporter transmembrane component T n=1 Tax=Desulfurispora sp. TaxID=3014275 RepID=UPI00404ABF74
MWHKLFYRERGSWLQSWHPLAALVYLGALLVLALSTDHPLYLLAALGLVVAGITALGAWEAGEYFLRPGLYMAALAALLNPLLIRAGHTVLGHLPLPGGPPVTMEALCYGAASGVRLLAVLGVFVIFNQLIHPDRLLGLLARPARRLALLLALSTRLVPRLALNLHNIVEVQTLRGVDFGRGGLKERAGKYLTVFNILLLTALEDAFQTAEAMQARALGSGPASRYSREKWRRRDTLVAGSSVLAVGLTAWSIMGGAAAFIYYPRLSPLLAGKQTGAILLALFLLLGWPAPAGWGEKYWRYWKSKS